MKIILSYVCANEQFVYCRPFERPSPYQGKLDFGIQVFVPLKIPRNSGAIALPSNSNSLCEECICDKSLLYINQTENASSVPRWEEEGKKTLSIQDNSTMRENTPILPLADGTPPLETELPQLAYTGRINKNPSLDTMAIISENGGSQSWEKHVECQITEKPTQISDNFKKMINVDDKTLLSDAQERTKDEGNIVMNGTHFSDTGKIDDLVHFLITS